MSALKLPLERGDSRRAVVFWKSSLPFVENSRGVLIHRPRYVHMYDLGNRWGRHLAVHYWCGNATSGTKHITFLSEPPENKLLCAVCDARAVLAELPSASSICGRHVHVGRVVAHQTCCPDLGGDQHG